jgi:hypothetical protein
MPILKSMPLVAARLSLTLSALARHPAYPSGGKFDNAIFPIFT